MSSNYCWPSLSLCHFPLSSIQCCQMLPDFSTLSFFGFFAFHGPAPSGFPCASLAISFFLVSSVFLPLLALPSMWGSLKGLPQVFCIFLRFPFYRLFLEFPFAFIGSVRIHGLPNLHCQLRLLFCAPELYLELLTLYFHLDVSCSSHITCPLPTLILNGPSSGISYLGKQYFCSLSCSC